MKLVVELIKNEKWLSEEEGGFVLVIEKVKLVLKERDELGMREMGLL